MINICAWYLGPVLSPLQLFFRFPTTIIAACQLSLMCSIEYPSEAEEMDLMSVERMLQAFLVELLKLTETDQIRSSCQSWDCWVFPIDSIQFMENLNLIWLWSSSFKFDLECCIVSQAHCLCGSNFQISEFQMLIFEDWWNIKIPMTKWAWIRESN